MKCGSRARNTCSRSPRARLATRSDSGCRKSYAPSRVIVTDCRESEVTRRALPHRSRGRFLAWVSELRPGTRRGRSAARQREQHFAALDLLFTAIAEQEQSLGVRAATALDHDRDFALASVIERQNRVSRAG